MTREDLQQIAELMDAKLQPIKDDMATMKSDIDKRFDSMETDMADMKKRMGSLEESQGNLYAEIRRTHVLIENQSHKIQLIAEQYCDIAKKLDKANERAAQVEDLQDRVRTLENVVMNHTAAIKELRKAE